MKAPPAALILLNTAICVMLALAPSLVLGPSTVPDANPARIQLTQNGATLLVTGVYSTEQSSTGTLSYTLRVVRVGAGGRSTSTQSGAFEAAPGTSKTLATSRVSSGAGDTLQVDLHIRKGDAVVSHAATRCVLPDCPFTDSTN